MHVIGITSASSRTAKSAVKVYFIMPAVVNELQVSFTPQLSGKAAKPQQAMLMASSKAHPSLAAYAVAKVKKGGSHVITLSTASIEKQLANVVSRVRVLSSDPDHVLLIGCEIGICTSSSTGSSKLSSL